jgi:hypothetical protein
MIWSVREQSYKFSRIDFENHKMVRNSEDDSYMLLVFQNQGMRILGKFAFRKKIRTALNRDFYCSGA